MVRLRTLGSKATPQVIAKLGLNPRQAPSPSGSVPQTRRPGSPASHHPPPKGTRLATPSGNPHPHSRLSQSPLHSFSHTWGPGPEKPPSGFGVLCPVTLGTLSRLLIHLAATDGTVYSPLQSPPPWQGSLGLSCSAPAVAGTWHPSEGGHRAQATNPAPGGDMEPTSGPGVQSSKAQPPEAAPTPPAAALGDPGQRTQQTGGRAPPEAGREHSALDPTATPGREAAAAPRQDC